jgi:hypothetical protein
MLPVELTHSFKRVLPFQVESGGLDGCGGCIYSQFSAADAGGRLHQIPGG